MSEMTFTADPARHTMSSTPIRTLEGLFDESTVPFLAVRLGSPAGDAVLLRREGRSADLVLDDGTVQTVYVGEPAQLIDDPVRQAALLRVAMRVLRDQGIQERVDTRAQAGRHREVLDEIRAYAIGKHRQDAICRDGLDRFLTRFDMDPYRPQVKVTFTMTGSYLVEEEDHQTARNDGEDSLAVDFSQVDDLVDGSDDYTVSQVDVESVNDDDDI